MPKGKVAETHKEGEYVTERPKTTEDFIVEAAKRAEPEAERQRAAQETAKTLIQKRRRVLGSVR